MRIALLNLKGGTSKTTSCVYLGCALARRGGDILLVDADPQGSAQLWADAAGQLPITIVGLATEALGQQLSQLTPRFDHVLIDTPPGHLGIASAAARNADIVLVSMTTGSVDLPRYRSTVELIDEARVSNPGMWAFTLITRSRAGTSSRREVREALESLNLMPVLKAEVPLREAIAGAEGTFPTDLDAYEDVCNELLERIENP